MLPIKDVSFFRDRGSSPSVALALVRGEIYAQERNWVFEWAHEENFHNPHEDWCDVEDCNGEHEVLYCTLTSDGEYRASLGGIIDPDRAYGRIVEAELACEAMEPRPVGRLDRQLTRYTVEPGRLICRDGIPFITIVREGDTSPTVGDKITHTIARLLNEHT